MKALLQETHTKEEKQKQQKIHKRNKCSKVRNRHMALFIITKTHDPCPLEAESNGLRSRITEPLIHTSTFTERLLHADRGCRRLRSVNKDHCCSHDRSGTQCRQTRESEIMEQGLRGKKAQQRKEIGGGRICSRKLDPMVRGVKQIPALNMGSPVPGESQNTGLALFLRL